MSSSERDQFTDASRDGSGQVTKSEVGHFIDMRPHSVAEEKREQGWDNEDRPTGAVRANPLDTSGSR